MEQADEPQCRVNRELSWPSGGGTASWTVPNWGKMARHLNPCINQSWDAGCTWRGAKLEWSSSCQWRRIPWRGVGWSLGSPEHLSRWESLSTEGGSGRCTTAPPTPLLLTTPTPHVAVMITVFVHYSWDIGDREGSSASYSLRQTKSLFRREWTDVQSCGLVSCVKEIYLT